MKAISILQPWASLVALGHKKIETRSWNTKYRGELLIHASASPVSKIIKKMPLSFWGLIKEVGLLTPDLPLGAIIGKVNLVECYPVGEPSTFTGYLANQKTWPLTKQEMAFGDYSPNRFVWLLSDPVLFDKPIPFKGQLGIWNFDVDHEIKRQEMVSNFENVELIKQILP